MSGVDQMKLPGNTGNLPYAPARKTAKSPEERNIPWSQQVDEASYENLASPATEDQNSAANQNSMQFQYPPFNAKENQIQNPWNNYNKARKPNANNYDQNKKYGKPGLYNNTKRDDYQSNNWGSRRVIGDTSTGNSHHRPIRSDEGFTSTKLDNWPNNTSDQNKTSAAPAVAAPKKTTWASIASQPAKLALRIEMCRNQQYKTTLTTSIQKKKGPGMPPPPMVPGKHNLDVNTWDLPNNNPPPIPSPPPPIDLACPDVNADFSLSVSQSVEPQLGARAEKPQIQKAAEYSQKDVDNSRVPLSNNISFGRAIRSSPNGHARKNWSTQHPLHPHPHSHPPRPMGPPAGPGAGVVVGSSVSSVRRIDSGSAQQQQHQQQPPPPSQQQQQQQNRNGERRPIYSASSSSSVSAGRNEYDGGNIKPQYESRDENSVAEAAAPDPHQLLKELRVKNNYNPAEINLEISTFARFFVIKSYSEDDIHRSIKYEIWCSTDHGNKRLDDAFKERQKDGGHVILFFSVNGSGHFCGMAQMMTAVDYNSTSSVWSQDKWKGKFKVKWIYVKDVPNSSLRHIRLENNDNKSVTNSRDTQEVPNAKGIEVLKILHSFKHSTSIFDDFSHYEKKQEEEVSSKRPPPFHVHDSLSLSAQPMQSPINRNFSRQNNDRDRDNRDRDPRDSRGIGIGPGGGGGGGGGVAQKYFDRGNNGGGGGGFRDRNNVQRSGGGGGGGGFHSNNYNNEFRRGFDNNQRSAGSDYQQQKERGEREREGLEADRDNDFVGVRHIQKFEYSRWDDHLHGKPRGNNRDRDFNSEQNKSDTRFRVGLAPPREILKDNDKERLRTTEY